MTTATLTLTDFLLARIAEDEAVARTAVGSPWNATCDAKVVAGYGSGIDGEILADCFHIDPAGDGLAPHIARHDPARVLAECEAKRRIVEEWGRVERIGTNGFGPGVLRHLASVYADHADYDPDWTP